MIEFNDYKSILCLDGELPDADFFKSDLPIFAADGAANSLMKIGITPKLTIGDLDSITPENREQLATQLYYDQNYCDFEKCLQYLEQNSLLPAIIVGVNGGFLDHILNNINYFMHTDCILYAPPLYGFVVREQETKRIKLPHHTKISLLAIPSATITTRGLKWELDAAMLSFPGHNSCFNRSVSDEVNIEVSEGSVLVLVYT